MKLLITQAMPERVAQAAMRFDTALRDGAPLSETEAAQALADYDAVLCTLGDAFRGAAFDGPLRCKLLANFGVGYSHLDVARAHAAGVAVTNTPGAVTDATADIALTLMLMCARRAGEGERLARSGDWNGWHPTQMLGTHMTGKRVGIVGMGRIGQAIAKRAMFGFDMQVSYFTRSPKDLPNLPGAQPFSDLHEMLGAVDFTVLAVPASPQTHHLIDADALGAMSPKSYLINIARGDVVDEAALIAHLDQGSILGAGLDVYEREPQIPEALRALDNVVLLPHLGTAAEEVRTGMGMMALDNACAYRDGQELPNPV